MEFTKEELAVILDGLSALPLARSYNLFNKILPLMQNGPIPNQLNGAANAIPSKRDSESQQDDAAAPN